MNSILIATDIFGVTPHINELTVCYTKQFNQPIVVVDPYNGDIQQFDDESQAYQQYLTAGGLEQYALKVNNALQAMTGNILIIGFSAGASAAYSCTKLNDDSQRLKHFIGFYPSQIRNQLDITPNHKVSLIFPISEPHFYLSACIDTLSKKKNVHCYQTPYHHGFINPLSKNYSPTAANYFCQQLVEIVDLNDVATLITQEQQHFV